MRLPVTARVQLFGSLPDVGGILKQEPAFPDVEQVQLLTAEKAKASLEEICKRSDLDEAFWQREREEIQGEVNRCVSRLRMEVLAAENAKTSLEEMLKRNEKDKAVWQYERESIHRQISRLQEEVLATEHSNALFEDIHKRSGEDKSVWQCEREEM